MRIRQPLAVLGVSALAASGLVMGAGAASAAPAPTIVNLPGSDIVFNADESLVYNQWHFGQNSNESRITAIAPEQQRRNGIVIEAGTEAQIITGNGNDAAVPANGAEQLTNLVASLAVSASDSSSLTHQIGIRIDTNGDGSWDGEGWSTLRAGVGAESGNWTTSKAIGTIPANGSASIEDIVAAAAATGANADIYPISYGFLAYKPASDVLVSSYATDSQTTKFYGTSASTPGSGTEYVDAAGIRPNEDTYAGWHNGDGSGTGSYETVAGEKDATLGLKVTGKAQILNGFADADFLPNAAGLAGQATVVADGETFLQVPVFAYPDGATATPVFTTIRAKVPASGKLADATGWTSSKALPGIAANSDTSLDAIVAALGEHDVIGYGFFVDSGRSATVQSIGFNGKTTAFFKAATPDPEDPAVEFTDVDDDAKFSKEIAWMAEAGISTGVKQPDGTVKYQPKANVTREAMAAFLYRLEAPNGYQAPAVSPFADVKPGDKFYTQIAWMWESKLATGIKQQSGKPKFAPKSHISREAMAAFIFRKDAESGVKVSSTSPFADVRTGQKFYTQIAWMYESGITTGIKQDSGKPKYQPKWKVTREAMAAFLYRAEHRK